MDLPNCRTRTISVWLFCSIVLSCSGILNNGCDKEEDECCCETEEFTAEELLPQEIGPMGFSAAHILDKIVGKSNTTFRWRDGSETKATVEISFDSIHIEYREEEYFDTECIENGYRYPDSIDSELDVDEVFAFCDRLVFEPVQVSLKTDDGNFDEVWVTTGVALESRDVYLLTQMVDPSSVRGDYQIPGDERMPNQGLRIIVSYQNGIQDGTVSVIAVPDKNDNVVDVTDENDSEVISIFPTVSGLVGCWGSCKFCQSEYDSCNRS